VRNYQNKEVCTTLMKIKKATKLKKFKDGEKEVDMFLLTFLDPTARRRRCSLKNIKDIPTLSIILAAMEVRTLFLQLGRS
jgi:hypothetical protein